MEFNLMRIGTIISNVISSLTGRPNPRRYTDADLPVWGSDSGCTPDSVDLSLTGTADGSPPRRYTEDDLPKEVQP